MYSSFKNSILFMTLVFSSLSLGTETDLFGETIQDLLSSKGFTSISHGKHLVRAKISFFTNKKTLCFTKTEHTHTTGRNFTSYHTTEDKCDGGNSIGWIENSKNEKIAEISDSFIYPNQKSHEDINWMVKGKAKNEEEALNKIKKHIHSSRSLWTSLFGYTLVSLEANDLTEDLSEENILNIMVNYLNQSSIELLENVEGLTNEKDKFFQLKYNMEGFIPYAYYSIDAKTGQVDFIQIDD